MKRLALICLTTLISLSFFTAHSAENEKGSLHVDPSKLPPALDKKDVTYSTDIKPLFEKSCVKCHGAEKPKGKLRLDSLEGTLKGGEDGKVVSPGKSAESMLVINIAHLGDPDDYMPPPKNKAGIQQLTKEEIGLIRAWIDQGAK
ncbi:MAG TPA: c-type cytochrome domain-containing protein [Candidatus Limnocylindrales bacterium]|nr:c-type cytochrome domain-containing protein [Candidatus Limnocylindrales bacterium]